MSLNEITKQIEKELQEKKGMSKETIEKKIKEKKIEYSGILSNSGAIYMIAKENGIKIAIAKKEIERVKINEIVEGLSNIKILVQIKEILPEKQFEKNGRKGKYCNLIVCDETGEIKLTLWHKNAEKIKELKAEKGDTILLNNVYITKYNEKLQLNLSYNGSILLNPENEKKIKVINSKITKLNDLKEEQEVDVICRISKIYPIKKFEYNGKKNKMQEIEFIDDNGKVNGIIWNERTEEIKELKENDLIKIENALVKENTNKGKLELSIGFKTRMLKNPKTKLNIPKIERKEKTEKEIKELKEEKQNCIIKGKIVRIISKNYYFNSCKKCGKKAEVLGEEFVCSKCGSIKEIQIKPIISIELDDGTQTIKTNLFGENAINLIKLNAEEIKKKSEEDKEKFSKELKEKLLGKRISMQVYTKKNSFSNELEAITKNLIEIKEEKEKLLEEIELLIKNN